ncbi:MAG: glycosyltransferase family 2 protein [bacterium]|nr:glycosyltransferase family 2 protein [bacterium]
MVNVSIIIPFYNSGKTIGKCLDSIYRSDYKDFEVIAVDDCSNDDSASIVKRYKCRYFKLKKNSGPATARNYGAKNAKGKIIFFLDSDTIIFKNTVSELVKSFKKGVDAVSGMYAKYPAERGVVQDYYALMKYYSRLIAKKGTYDLFEAACAGIKRDVFLKLGGFNTNYKGADTENEEFAHRLVQKHKSILNKKVQVIHHSPSLKSLRKNFYKRSFMWIKLFLERKKFESALTTPEVGIANMAGLASAGFLVLGFIFPLFFYVALLSFIVFLIGYMGYFVFFMKEGGFFFMISCIAICYFLTLPIGIGAVFGAADYILLRKTQ